MKIGIHGKYFTRSSALVREVFRLLKDFDSDVVVSERFNEILHESRWKESYSTYT